MVFNVVSIVGGFVDAADVLFNVVSVVGAGVLIDIVDVVLNVV